MTTFLLILHGLIAVALLGTITHQGVSVLRSAPVSRRTSFVERYVGVNQKAFTTVVVLLYAASVVLGGVIYPAYRLDVRIPFEEMGLHTEVGLFELKEHFAGVGLGVLPLYAYAWSDDGSEAVLRNRRPLTLLLLFIVWWDFIVGHVLNNIRGLA